MDDSTHCWLNTFCLLVLCGAAVYASLIPYMTRDR